MTEARQRRVRFREEKRRMPSNTVIFIVFFIVAALGYVAGTYNRYIAAAVLPIIGINATASTLDLSSLQQTYEQLKTNFDGTLDDQTLIDGAHKGLVAAAGDEYTVYLDNREVGAFNDELTGTIGGGIGAEIGIRNDRPTVVNVLDNNPAKAAGVLTGDAVMKVNDEDVSTQTVEEVVSKIRGEVGTTVKVEVARGVESKTFTITRALVNNPSVTSSVSNSLGTIKISRFDENTADLARSAAASLKQQGVKAVILDLRDNGGGYLDASQAVAGLWLNDKLVVSEKKNGKTVDELYSTNNPVLEGLPTVVLVNTGTASASEIVTGALKDYGAATVIGEKTYGKGSVQQLINLDGGAQLKVTIAKWYTPKGANINKEGITPDQIVQLTVEDLNAGRDPQLEAAKKQLGL